MWRKTRKPHPIAKICKGADPNRNFDFHHAESGASTLPCAEVKLIVNRQIFETLSKYIKYFLDICWTKTIL